MVPWFPVEAELVLRIAAAEPPERHVHGLEHFIDHGVVGDANGCRVIALDGQAGLRPYYFCEIVLKGYHSSGSDEEA